MAVTWNCFVVVPVLILACVGEIHSLPGQTDGAHVTAMQGDSQTVQCIGDMMQSDMIKALKAELLTQAERHNEKENTLKKTMYDLETKLNESLGREEVLKEIVTKFNETQRVMSCNMKKEGECPLKNGHEIKKQLLKYSSSKDHKALKNSLKQLLDSDSAAYKQLQGITSFSYPMYRVVYYELEELARVLVLCGGAVNIADSRGYTMLHGAATGGHLDAAKWLVDHGADIGRSTRTGHTPLMWAAYIGHLEVVKYLVEAGANTADKNNAEQTALDRARSSLKTDVVKYLSKFPH